MSTHSHVVLRNPFLWVITNPHLLLFHFHKHIEIRFYEGLQGKLAFKFLSLACLKFQKRKIITQGTLTSTQIFKMGKFGVYLGMICVKILTKIVVLCFSFLNSAY